MKEKCVIRIIVDSLYSRDGRKYRSSQFGNCIFRKVISKSGDGGVLLSLRFQLQQNWSLNSH